MKKSKRDLEMKHKNRSSQTHSKISLQRFEMGEARDVWEGVGGVSQVRNKVLCVPSYGEECGGVYKGAPKSWWPLGKSDWKTVEPVLKPVEPDSTRGFSVHWRTQPETGPDSNSVELVSNSVQPVSNSVEPVFQKSAHDFFWQDWLADWQWQRGTVQKPVEPVLGPVEPVFELLHRFWENRSETRVKWKF